jgi:DNA-binding MarR family transcriptional regulator
MSAQDLTDPLLAEIGGAVFQLRRVWSRPDMMRKVREQTGSQPLQASNLMVVHAIAHLTGETHEAQARETQAREGKAREGKAREAQAREAQAREAQAREAEALGEVTVGAVAERLEIDPSTASRLVGHAIDAGLVSRRPSPTDARRANLQLTEAGERVKQVSHRFRMAYLANLMEDWAEEEKAEFARLLTRFTDAVARCPLGLEGIGKIFEEAGAR